MSVSPLAGWLLRAETCLKGMQKRCNACPRGVRGGGSMEFRVLGRLEVTRDRMPLLLGGTKQRAALALLLLRRGDTATREELIDGIWGAGPPRSAEQTLTAYISRLRRALDTDGEPTRLVRE